MFLPEKKLKCYFSGDSSRRDRDGSNKDFQAMQLMKILEKIREILWNLKSCPQKMDTKMSEVASRAGALDRPDKGAKTKLGNCLSSSSSPRGSANKRRERRSTNKMQKKRGKRKEAQKVTLCSYDYVIRTFTV